MKYEDGVHEISNASYHSSEGVSRSGLMLMQKTPFHYYHKYLSGDYQPGTASPAMIFGELVHTLCLEPHEFDARFTVAPKVDRRTKAGKEAWYQFELATKGKGQELIKQEDYDKASAMAQAFRTDSFASQIMSNEVQVEKSIYFHHEATGLQFKVRPDVWFGAFVGDVKTTDSAKYRDFQNSMVKYGYLLQAGMIKQGLASIGIDMTHFCFMCLEKESPHAVANYMLSQDAIQYGSDLFDKLAGQLKACLDSNEWEGYGVKIMEVPEYLKGES